MTEDSSADNDPAIRDQFGKLYSAIIEGNSDLAREAAIVMKAHGVRPLEVVSLAVRPAMDEVGRRYDKLEVFLPELVLAGDAAQEALKLLFTREGMDSIAKGKIVLGTIFGDIHDIGKNITAAILIANGYQVIDIGNDAPPEKFVETAKREGANIIGMSCLLTPSMYFMRDVVRRLNDEGIREKFHVIIGGAAIYPGWAKEIQADGWAKDAEGAVQLCDMLVQKDAEHARPLIVGEWR
jgi:methylmalonyl-CoA mutase cobalamin-binding domain/chain